MDGTNAVSGVARPIFENPHILVFEYPTVGCCVSADSQRRLCYKV